jgi:hypothetical protein
MSKRALLLALLAASLLAGCVGCGLHQANTHIDWVDFVRFGGITYLANFHAGRDIQQTDIGPQFATVRHTLSGTVNDPNYQTEDGAAAYIAAGSPVYRVNGYAPTFRLAADRGGRFMLYEADTNPHAKTGADLLDIGGKVRSITVNDESGTSERTVVTITDPQKVRALMALLLAAPVDQTHEAGNGPQYFLTFALKDGTQVIRAYFPESHDVERGIIVPAAFVSMLAALGAK